MTSMMSDHFLININASLQKQSVSGKVISYRKNKGGFACWSPSLFSVDVDHLVDLYDGTLRDFIDEHVSLRTEEMPRRPMIPWYNTNIQAAKRHIRIRTSLCVDYEMFKVSTILVKNTLASANLNILIKRSKHPREIKGLFSVLWIKYCIKVKLSSQIISTQIKIWPIVLIASSVRK